MRIKPCTNCGQLGHSKTFCWQAKKKRPKQQSAKELEYQEWKETVARPAVIARDGNHCQCCGRPAREGEKLDLEHEKGKGTRPDLKRVLSNFRLFCRYPCHDNKTNNRPCLHTAIVI